MIQVHCRSLWCNGRLNLFKKKSITLGGSLVLSRLNHQVQTPEGVEQRARRPLSPHVTIYQPQLTWLMSIGHRVSGAGLATLVYSFGIYYAIIQPGAVTESFAQVITSVPNSLVTCGKFILSLPFFYHLLNGIRHLVWDMGYSFSLRATYTGGWIVNGLSIIFAAATSIL